MLLYHIHHQFKLTFNQCTHLFQTSSPDRQWQQQHKEQKQTQIFHLAIKIKWTQHFMIDHYLNVIKQKLCFIQVHNAVVLVCRLAIISDDVSKLIREVSGDGRHCIHL